MQRVHTPLLSNKAPPRRPRKRPFFSPPDGASDSGRKRGGGADGKGKERDSSCAGLSHAFERRPSGSVLSSRASRGLFVNSPNQCKAHQANSGSGVKAEVGVASASASEEEDDETMRNMRALIAEVQVMRCDIASPLLHLSAWRNKKVLMPNPVWLEDSSARALIQALKGLHCQGVLEWRHDCIAAIVQQEAVVSEAREFRLMRQQKQQNVAASAPALSHANVIRSRGSLLMAAQAQCFQPAHSPAFMGPTLLVIEQARQDHKPVVTLASFLQSVAHIIHPPVLIEHIRKHPTLILESRSNKYRPLIREFAACSNSSASVPTLWLSAPRSSIPWRDPRKVRRQPHAPTNANKSTKYFCEVCQMHFQTDLNVHLDREQHIVASRKQNWQPLQHLHAILSKARMERFATILATKGDDSVPHSITEEHDSPPASSTFDGHEHEYSRPAVHNQTSIVCNNLAVVIHSDLPMEGLVKEQEMVSRESAQPEANVPHCLFDLEAKCYEPEVLHENVFASSIAPSSHTYADSEGATPLAAGTCDQSRVVLLNLDTRARKPDVLADNSCSHQSCEATRLLDVKDNSHTPSREKPPNHPSSTLDQHDSPKGASFLTPVDTNKRVDVVVSDIARKQCATSCFQPVRKRRRNFTELSSFDQSTSAPFSQDIFEFTSQSVTTEDCPYQNNRNKNRKSRQKTLSHKCPITPSTQELTLSSESSSPFANKRKSDFRDEFSVCNSTPSASLCTILTPSQPQIEASPSSELINKFTCNRKRSTRSQGQLVSDELMLFAWQFGIVPSQLL